MSGSSMNQTAYGVDRGGRSGDNGWHGNSWSGAAPGEIKTAGPRPLDAACLLAELAASPGPRPVDGVVGAHISGQAHAARSGQAHTYSCSGQSLSDFLGQTHVILSSGHAPVYATRGPAPAQTHAKAAAPAPASGGFADMLAVLSECRREVEAAPAPQPVPAPGLGKGRGKGVYNRSASWKKNKRHQVRKAYQRKVRRNSSPYSADVPPGQTL